MTTLDIYSKQQVDAMIPDNSAASIGDVLAKGANGNEWITPSSGSSLTDAQILSLFVNGISGGYGLTASADTNYSVPTDSGYVIQKTGTVTYLGKSITYTITDAYQTNSINTAITSDRYYRIAIASITASIGGTSLTVSNRVYASAYTLD